MRKSQQITIDFDGRDKGKKFLITEMSAVKAEEWATRALFAMGKTNTEIPPEALGAGWSIVAFMGVKALLGSDYYEVKPLLEDMMQCVQSVQEVGTRPLIESDIEEVATIVYLRDEVFKLHANFSIRESLLTARSVLASVDLTSTQ